MKKFMVIGYTTKEGHEYMKNMPKEKRQENMNKWFAWKEKLGEQIIDLGSPLIKGTKLSLEGKKESANKEISGYMMIQAESMDEAFSLIEESPMSEHVPGSTFEIYECMDMNN